MNVSGTPMPLGYYIMSALVKSIHGPLHYYSGHGSSLNLPLSSLSSFSVFAVESKLKWSVLNIPLSTMDEYVMKAIKTVIVSNPPNVLECMFLPLKLNTWKPLKFPNRLQPKSRPALNVGASGKFLFLFLP